MVRARVKVRVWVNFNKMGYIKLKLLKPMNKLAQAYQQKLNGFKALANTLKPPFT